MEKDYDEIISDILIQLVTLGQANEKLEAKMESHNKRMDLTIRRIVKVEQRLETIEKQLESISETQKIFVVAQEQKIRSF